MYLTVAEAEARLETRFNITAELEDGDLMAASDTLGELAPFSPPLEDYATLPDALLDWVALKAHTLAQGGREGLTGHGVAGISASYAWPQLSRDARRMEALIAPYLKRTGTRV